MNNKIGVAVITCSRENMFQKCIASIPSIDTLIVINDGDTLNNVPTNVKEFIQHTKNVGVGLSKNEALRHLLQDGCEHLFLVEDDMLIANPNVFVDYIHAAENSGIWHMNFGYHGPANKNPNNYDEKAPRQILNYDGIDLAFNRHCVGSFSYYYKNIIRAVGYMDEMLRFNNFEHVEHTYRIIKAGLHPAFWWFADLANSDEYIKEQAKPSPLSSRSEKWKEDFSCSAEYFKYKHGYVPTHVPDTTEDDVLLQLESIKNNYARKVL